MAHIAPNKQFLAGSLRPNMSNTSAPDFEVIRQAIGERHLEQLRNLNLVVDPLENYPIRATYDDLVNWTNASKTQIETGTANSEYPYRCAITKFDETWAKGVYGGPIG